MTAADKFVMPAGAVCDVPGCGQPARNALVPTRTPVRVVPGSDPDGTHVYICQPHWHELVATPPRIPMPDKRHYPWPRKQG
jgi:hypothetical protein